MQVSQCVFPDGQIPHFPPHLRTGTGQLILFFGSTALLSDSAYFLPLRKAFPDAIIAGCSTAGEIHGTTVSDDTVVVTIIDFEHTRLHFSKVEKIKSKRKLSKKFNH